MPVISERARVLLEIWARQGGVTMTRAAEVLGCHRTTVRRAAEVAGVPFRTRGSRTYRAAMPARIAAIRAAADAGVSMSAVARDLKCSVGNISRLAQKYGITFRRTGLGGRPRKAKP